MPVAEEKLHDACPKYYIKQYENRQRLDFPQAVPILITIFWGEEHGD